MAAMSFKLGVIADDMTGALDTGVRFASAGMRVYVSRDAEVPSGPEAASGTGAGVIEAVVLNTQSRHLAPDAAYRRVYGAARALSPTDARIYKKTDSVLRGNIGAELAAVSDALRCPVCFVPFYPALGRSTRGGIQYVGGAPIAGSHAAADPHNPVTSSYIPEIIAVQSAKRVALALKPYALPGEWPDILVFDGDSEEDLGAIRTLLSGAGRMRLTAGCAGFAAYLADGGIAADASPARPPAVGGPAFILSGSVNPVTREQLRHAGENGLSVFGPGDAELCAKTLSSGISCALSAHAYGGIDPLGALNDTAERVLAAVTPGLTVVIGGDTLLRHMELMGLPGMTPLMEPLPGAPLSMTAKGLYVTRSGGFGAPDALMRLIGWAGARVGSAS